VSPNDPSKISSCRIVPQAVTPFHVLQLYFNNQSSPGSWIRKSTFCQVCSVFYSPLSSQRWVSKKAWELGVCGARSTRTQTLYVNFEFAHKSRALHSWGEPSTRENVGEGGKRKWVPVNCRVNQLAIFFFNSPLPLSCPRHLFRPGERTCSNHPGAIIQQITTDRKELGLRGWVCALPFPPNAEGWEGRPYRQLVRPRWRNLEHVETIRNSAIEFVYRDYSHTFLSYRCVCCMQLADGRSTHKSRHESHKSIHENIHVWKHSFSKCAAHASLIII